MVVARGAGGKEIQGNKFIVVRSMRPEDLMHNIAIVDYTVLNK